MKAKSRRRLLISSIAMLLVAMLALGTATFAWFSQNAKATASGIVAKTQRGSNIVVSEGGSVYDDAITFETYASGFYNPVTPGANMASPVWKTTTADAVDAGVKGAAKTYEDATPNSDYTSTNLYIKYDTPDTTATQSVDIKMTVTSNGTSATQNFLRVALVPVDATTQALVADPVVWGTAADDFAKEPNNMSLTTAATSTQTITTITNSNPMISNITLTGGTPIHFNVYVWYEGTDPHCIDSNANNNFTVDFEIAKHT